MRWRLATVNEIVRERVLPCMQQVSSRNKMGARGDVTYNFRHICLSRGSLNRVPPFPVDSYSAPVGIESE